MPPTDLPSPMHDISQCQRLAGMGEPVGDVEAWGDRKLSVGGLKFADI